MIKAMERGCLLLVGSPHELSKVRGLLGPHSNGCQAYSAVGIRGGKPSHALFYKGVLDYMYNSRVTDALDRVQGVTAFKLDPEGLTAYNNYIVSGLWVTSKTLPPSSNFYKVGDFYISQVEDFDNA